MKEPAESGVTVHEETVTAGVVTVMVTSGVEANPVP